MKPDAALGHPMRLGRDPRVDGEYSDELYTYWHVKVPLPTRYVREVALPESLVRPGGRVSGLVYSFFVVD